MTINGPWIYDHTPPKNPAMGSSTFQEPPASHQNANGPPRWRFGWHEKRKKSSRPPPWRSSSEGRCCVQCADSTPGTLPLKQVMEADLSSSSLQTTWPLGGFWLHIFHRRRPSHESLRLCIQTLTHSDSPEGWKCQRQAPSDRWAVTVITLLPLPNCTPPHFHIHPSHLLLADNLSTN